MTDEAEEPLSDGDFFLWSEESVGLGEALKTRGCLSILEEDGFHCDDENPGEPVIEFWFETREDFSFKISLIDIEGWDAEMAGSAFSRKCADVFDELAKKARASADEWDRENK